jgi:tetratricopeptide (TPR) repeat protein
MPCHSIAIRINPQYAIAYTNRGVAKSALGDRKGAIADYQIAAKIFKAQNNMASYDRVMSLIQQLSRQ